MYPVFTPQQKDFTENRRLTLEQMRYVFAHQNNENREISPTRVKNISKAIKNGLWNWNFYEGKQVVVSHTTGNILSGQHRLEAMIDQEVAHWDVTVQYVERDEWLLLSIEKRTPADRIQINSGGAINRQVAKAIGTLASQLPKITTGHVDSSGVHPSRRTSDAEVVRLYGAKAMTAWNILSFSIKQNKPLTAILIGLFCINKITAEDLEDANRRTGRIGTACEWLVEAKLYGVGSGVGGISSYPYGMAVLIHAKNTVHTTDYQILSDSEKPIFRSNGRYYFSDYL